MVKFSGVRRLALPAAAALLLAGSATAADAPAPLFDSTHAAVTDGRVEKSRLLGVGGGSESFRETPHGGAVLVGFDVSLGKWLSTELVYGVEPLYLTSLGVTVSTKSYGIFPRNLPPAPLARDVKPRLTRVVRVKAKPGYAVGGLTVRSGLLMDGVSVTF